MADDKKYLAWDEDLQAHVNNKSNPHGVTKSQVGLGNVDNTSDKNKPVSTAQATAIADAKKAGTDAQDDIDDHIANKNNPHGVTAAQIGARPDTWMPTASDVGAVSVESYVEAGAFNAIQTKKGENWYRFQFITNTDLDSPFYLQLWKSTDSGLTWSAVKNYNLEKLFLSDGSVPMSGDLTISNAIARLRADNNGVITEQLESAYDTNNSRGLWIISKESSPNANESLIYYDIDNGHYSPYKIFGEHNKPSGTYSGNGGSQTIDTGGLGDVILVQLTGSGGGFALVTKSGAIGKLNSNNSVFALADTEAKFIGGVLTLNSSNYGVNRSGYGYNWQVL